MIKAILIFYVCVALGYFLLNVCGFCSKVLNDIQKYAGVKQTAMEMFEEEAAQKGDIRAGLNIIFVSFIGSAFWPITFYLLWKFWDRL